jgi:hypothetical protein
MCQGRRAPPVDVTTINRIAGQAFRPWALERAVEREHPLFTMGLGPR